MLDRNRIRYHPGTNQTRVRGAFCRIDGAIAKRHNKNVLNRTRNGSRFLILTDPAIRNVPPVRIRARKWGHRSLPM